MAKSNALVKINDYDTENKLLLKERGIYVGIIAEEKNEINPLNNKIENDKSKYHFKSKNRKSISFNSFNLRHGLIRKLEDSSIDLEKAKENLDQI